jgi:imidazoleglycerol phosphate dehydratase HisB
MMRKGEANAELNGSKASACLDLDGSGEADICSGSGFLDHMLKAFVRTGHLDLKAKAKGGLYNFEALAAAIGLTMDRSLKDRSGIHRYGAAAVPMDEALAEVALDFSGRPCLIFAGNFKAEKIGDFQAQEVKSFLEAFSNSARMTLHVRFYGENDHHMAESIFKALGLAVRQAVAKEGMGVPSTKGVI